ncbi:MAG TPA: SDR family oxidoreductase [Candidatus Saccharimonadales bacterium]|nr:SDR family oxidoreductase [Candidatus Saccharimonadales bacterium]
MQTQSKGLAVITGASSGIGAVYADRLSRRGYDLLLVARSRGPMDGLAKKLAASTGRKIDILAADLTDAKDLAGLERFLRQNSNVTLLVNNAGLGATKALLNSDVSDMSRIIALNVEALTRLTYAVVPEFVKRGSGTIINIGSVVGVAPEILNGVYGGTKAYVLAFSQSLRHELADKGIAVQVVLPGATATDFWGKAGKPVGHLPQEIVMTAEDMVDASLVGLDQGEFVTIPALPDAGLWQSYEAARQALSPYLSCAEPASRYGVVRAT